MLENSSKWIAMQMGRLGKATSYMEMPIIWGLPRQLSDKESTCQCRRRRRLGFNPWVRKIPWSRKWQPLQYSCLENSMDRGAWWATVHGVTKSQRWLSKWAPIHTCYFEAKVDKITCPQWAKKISHKFVLYNCESVYVLDIHSFVLYFGFHI